MSNSWDKMGKAKEESYFDRKNREAIERLQQQQNDGEPARPSPITGKPMEKVALHGVIIDRCVDSGGVWLDAGELEELASHMKEDEQESSVLNLFKSLAGLKK